MSSARKHCLESEEDINAKRARCDVGLHPIRPSPASLIAIDALTVVYTFVSLKELLCCMQTCRAWKTAAPHGATRRFNITTRKDSFESVISKMYKSGLARHIGSLTVVMTVARDLDVQSLHLEQFVALRTLTLRPMVCAPFKDIYTSIMSRLALLPALETLDVSYCSLEPSTLARVPLIRTLRTLFLGVSYGAKSTAATAVSFSLQQMALHPNPSVDRVSAGYFLQRSVFSHLAVGFPALTSLQMGYDRTSSDIFGAHPMSSKIIPLLEMLPCLREVHIDDGLRSFVDLSVDLFAVTLPQLVRLWVSSRDHDWELDDDEDDDDHHYYEDATVLQKEDATVLQKAAELTGFIHRMPLLSEFCLKNCRTHIPYGVISTRVSHPILSCITFVGPDKYLASHKKQRNVQLHREKGPC